MKKTIVTLLAAACALAAAAPALADGERARFGRKVRDANDILERAISDRSIPERLLSHARAVAIFPDVVKGGFLWGGRYGEGVVVARGEDGAWSAPAYFTIAGGSWGLQIGVQSADVILLVMNDAGLRALLKQKFTLGADAEIAAGPEGGAAEADVDVALRAEILSYTRSRGIFAGVSVDGARIARSDRVNEAVYGARTTVDDIIIRHAVEPPESAAPLLETLRRATHEPGGL